MASANIFVDCETEEEVDNTLMTSFCCDYLDTPTWKDKFEKFKMKSFLHLKSPAEQSSISKTHDIWEGLVKKGLLGPNNYSELKKLIIGIDVELMDLIEDAEDKILMLRGEGSPGFQRQRALSDRDINFRQRLLQIYDDEVQRIPVSPLQKTSRIALEKIFAPISIREDLEYRAKGRNIGLPNKRSTPIKCADDMFYIGGIMARNVFMLGEAGIGKSVFCHRLVENWCKAQKENKASSNGSNERLRSWVDPFRKFDFLFFIQLRLVNKCRSSVIDMIVKDMLHSYPSSHDVIHRVIMSEKYRFLIVTDGLDEWKFSDEIKQELSHEYLPNIENMANCTFIWSLRPWVMERFSDIIRGNDRVVEIQGLDQNGVNIVIEKLLVHFYELNEKSTQFKQKVKEIKYKSHDSKLKSIMQIPLMAVACVQIWYEEKEVGNSLTSLYVALLDLLIRRSNQKSLLSTETRDNSSNIMHASRIFQCNRNIKEALSLIMKLGRLAYDYLVSRNTCIVFQKEDLEKYLENYEIDIALEIGLLSKCEAPGSCNEENISVNFFHKSMQEFLAAIHIEDQLDILEFLKHLSNLNAIMELGNILIFLSGINPMLGSSISKHIVDVANADIEICNFRRLSGLTKRKINKTNLLYELQAVCYKEISYSQTKTKQFVPYHTSDVYLTVDSDVETIRTTVDILQYHHKDIRSLVIRTISTVVENGISDSILTQFLQNTKLLESLYLNGSNLSWALSTTSAIFSSITYLILSNIILTPDTLRTLQTALQSNKVIKTLGLVRIGCHIDKHHVPLPASLSGIIQILPHLQSLTVLHICVTNKDDKHVFRYVLGRLSHMHDLLYFNTLPRDDEYDLDVIQIVCTWLELHRLYLHGVNLGDRGLNLSSGMLNIKEVILNEVKMSVVGWRYFIQSIPNIKHAFNVFLTKVNIDEENKTMLRTCKHIKILVDHTNNDGSHDFRFYRKKKTN